MSLTINFRNALRAFRRDERGATLVEYGLIASILGIAIELTLQLIKGNLVTTFTRVNSNLS